jgi:hypothetical protein
MLGSIAFPFDEVLETSTPSSRVEDGFDLIFFFSFNHNGRWLFLFASRDSVCRSGVKVRHVKYWVDTHGRRELKFVCEGTHFLKDFEGAQMSEVEFLRGAIGLDIFPIEPNLVSRVEFGNFSHISIVEQLHLFLGEFHRRLDFFLDFLYLSDAMVDRGDKGRSRGDGRESRMTSIVGEKGRSID